MEQIKENLQIPETIRRTYIETYRACPYKFLKEVIEGNKQPPTSYTQIGQDLHEFFENVCLNRAIPKESVISKMKTLFDNYLDEIFSSGFKSDTREDLWERTINSIETFYDVVLPNLPTLPFTVEETIHFNVGENLPKVEFTMDRVDLINGELEISDWKTGRLLVGQKLSSDLQAPLYIYGTREHFQRPVRKFTFYYLNENKTRTFTRSKHDDDLYICLVGKREYHIRLSDTIRTIQHVFSQIKKGNFNIPQDVKKMYFTCKMCHLQKEGLCEGADMQSWQNAKEGRFSWT